MQRTMLQSLGVGALLVFSWQTVLAEVYEATISIAIAPLLAIGLAHANSEPLARHLSAWVLRSHFVGFVRPIEASETVWLEIVEPHANMVTLLGPDGNPIRPNEQNEIPLGKAPFREVRCQVQGVVKGPPLSQVTILTYAVQADPTKFPRPLPAQLATGSDLLVFLIEPDPAGRLDLRADQSQYSAEAHHGECNMVRARSGVLGLLNSQNR